MLPTRSPFEVTAAEHEAEVLRWRDARRGRLTGEKGWLTLVGKVWLTPGRLRIGSAPDSEILLPDDRAPASVGTLTFDHGVATLDADPAVELRARGGRVGSIVLRSDAEKEPDQVTLGSLTLELIRRGDDFAVRIRDSKSAARLSFAGVPMFPIDPAWRVVAKFEEFSAPRGVDFDDGDGRVQHYLAPGVATFERNGAACRLLPVLESDGKRLFVLFKDATNRDETYGAGRFLYAPLPASGRVLLDFNMAFNPPCAFSPYAVCPLPPPDNRLTIRVEAGEKRPPED
jgi:uncharacterized protein (DUF1684 family)